MRVGAVVVVSLVFQLLTFASLDALAQSDGAPTAMFLDFGVPCNDPLPEAELPKPLNGAVTAPASDPSRPLSAPEFPPVSRRLNEQGTAVMRLLITETGEVSEAHIFKSTGSPRLDNAALEVTRGWRLRPGKFKDKPRCMWGKFAVSFVLTDYGQEELERVNVGPEARQLAHHLMGTQELKKALAAESMPTEAARQMIDLVVGAASAHPKWVDAEDKVARILATEFTPEELAELNRFFGSPVAAKWTSLTFKMTPAIMEEQLLVNQTLACSILAVDTALKAKNPAEVMANDALVESYRAKIPAFVDQSIPFCACLLDKERRAATGGRTNTIGNCGLPPSLD